MDDPSPNGDAPSPQSDPEHRPHRPYIIDSTPKPPIEKFWIEADALAAREGGSAVYLPPWTSTESGIFVLRGKPYPILRHLENWTDAKGGAVLIIDDKPLDRLNA